MNLHKKLLSCVFVLAVALVCLFVLPTEAQAATSGYYTYSVSNGEATITDCDTSISGNITIPTTLGGYPVTSIGNYACYNCHSLISVTIPDSVTSIGNYAFYYCTSLTSVTIPDSVTSIGNYAFSSCKRLTSVTIPDSVTSIGNDAFSYCTSLTSVTIPDSVTSIGSSAFEYCSSLTYNVYGEAKYLGNSKNPYFALVDTTSNSITSCRIHTDAKIIASFAFASCYNLTSVTIGNSVTSIGNYAFYYCTSLTSVTIGNSVTSIGGDAFSECNSLTSVTIPDSVTSIGNYAFYNCHSLISVTIPDSVTSIGDWAFRYCDSLTSIEVDKNNAVYSSDAKGVLFNKDKTTLIQAPGAITGSYVIPNSVTSIGERAFYYCTSLTSVTIGDSVTSIGDYAFYYCTSLTSVTYCGTEEQWNQIAMGTNNETLTNATRSHHDYDDGVVTTEPTTSAPGVKTYTCIDCGATKTEAIPQLEKPSVTGTCGDNLTWTLDDDGTLTISGSGAMTHFSLDGAPWYDLRSSIKKVIIEDGVTSIGGDAFSECNSLTSVTIPDSVTSIGSSAFRYCDSLTSVTYCGTEEQWNQIAIGTGNEKLVNATRSYHDYDDGVVTTAPTYEAAGVMTYTCSACGNTYTEEIPRLEAPAVTGTFARKGITLSLSGLTYMNVYVTIEGFEDIDIAKNGGLLAWNSAVTEAEAVIGTEDYHTEGLIYNSSYKAWAQQTNGIVARMYADTIYIRAYVKDPAGNYYYSDIMDESVREYCEGRIANSTDAKMVAACTELLHYGAAAQIYKDYNTGDLANKNISAGAEFNESMIDELVAPNTKIVGSDLITLKGSTLSLGDAVRMNCYVTLDSGMWEAATTKMYFWQGVEGELTLENATSCVDMVYSSGNHAYAGQSEDIVAKSYGETIYACAYVVDVEGNAYYSEVYNLSPEQYALGRVQNSANANMVAVAKALVVYGEAAKAYLNK